LGAKIGATVVATWLAIFAVACWFVIAFKRAGNALKGVGLGAAGLGVLLSSLLLWW
jgi:hypothetical protein